MTSPIEQLANISIAAKAQLATTFNAPDVVPFGREALELIAAYPNDRELFGKAFVAGIIAPCNSWDWWFVSFCVHALRWPELKAGFEAALGDALSRNDWNLINPLGHILDAFEDDWEDAGDFYGVYFDVPKRA